MKGDERVQTVEERADSALLWQSPWNEIFPCLKKMLRYNVNSFINSAAFCGIHKNWPHNLLTVR